MDFIEKIRQFSAEVRLRIPNIKTEEATKQSLVLPFLQILGYNVFNPTEVEPEFISDVGIKKGEKVDYAIHVNGQPCILIEAKSCTENLERHDSQLFRYFAATQAKFAILTNGILYRFYTDLQAANKMDLVPFLEFNILEPKESLVQEIRQITKEKYNADDLLVTATRLEYSSKIISKLDAEMSNPSSEILKYFLQDVHGGIKTQAVLEKYKPIVQAAFSQYINDKINDRLKTALTSIEKEKQAAEPQNQIVQKEEDKPKIVTTETEIEAYYVIKSIIRGLVDLNRISYKDTSGYFAILLDGLRNNWICRIVIGESKKKLVLPNTDRNLYFENVDDIYKHSNEIMDAAKTIIGILKNSD